MKHLILICLLVLASANIYSQKVTITKDILFLDNAGIGKVQTVKTKDPKGLYYLFTDMAGKNELKMIRYQYEKRGIWFSAKSSFSQDTSEVAIDYQHFSSKELLRLADLLVNGYHFFDKNGMNVDNVNAYLAKPFEPQIGVIKKRIAMEEKVAAMNLRLRSNGDVLKGAEGTIIGKFLNEPVLEQTITESNPVVILDASGKEVARLVSLSLLTNNCNLRTHDGKILVYKSGTALNNNNRLDYFKNLADMLAIDGYLK